MANDRQALASRIEGNLGPFNFITADERATVVAALRGEREDNLDPTTRGDLIAEKMRDYYEAHRETWWQRRKRRVGLADNLMLGLLNLVEAELRRDE